MLVYCFVFSVWIVVKSFFKDLSCLVLFTTIEIESTKYRCSKGWTGWGLGDYQPLLNKNSVYYRQRWRNINNMGNCCDQRDNSSLPNLQEQMVDISDATSVRSIAKGQRKFSMIPSASEPIHACFSMHRSCIFCNLNIIMQITVFIFLVLEINRVPPSCSVILDFLQSRQFPITTLLPKSWWVLIASG